MDRPYPKFRRPGRFTKNGAAILYSIQDSSSRLIPEVTVFTSLSVTEIRFLRALLLRGFGSSIQAEAGLSSQVNKICNLQQASRA
jgi:hypothetical protein